MCWGETIARQVLIVVAGTQNKINGTLRGRRCFGGHCRGAPFCPALVKLRRTSFEKYGQSTYFYRAEIIVIFTLSLPGNGVENIEISGFQEYA
jgi:hypothetical protein